jgi:hypothetical protein
MRQRTRSPAPIPVVVFVASIMVAGESLEPERPTARIPGLISQPDRAFLAATETAEIRVVAGCGHNIQYLAPMEMLRALRDAVAQPQAARRPD